MGSLNLWDTPVKKSLSLLVCPELQQVKVENEPPLSSLEVTSHCHVFSNRVNSHGISGPIKGQVAVLTLAAADVVPFHPRPFARATCTKVDTKTDQSRWVAELLGLSVSRYNQLRPVLWLRGGTLKKVMSRGAAQSLPYRMISRQPSVASSRLGW